MNLSDFHPSFWSHVEELRNTLVKCILVILAASVIAFLNFDRLYPLFTSPLKTKSPISKVILVKERIKNNTPFEQSIKIPQGKITYISKNGRMLTTEEGRVILPAYGSLEWEAEKDKTSLILLGPLEGMTASLKISFWAGLFLASPFCCFFILQFIYPALHRHEKTFTLPFAFLSFLFLFCGALFAFFVTVPFTNKLLGPYNEGLGINLWTVAHYINYTLVLTFSTSVAFELTLILFFLVHWRAVSEERLKKMRPISYASVFFLSALLTPPDIFTQISLALPLIGIYELSIVYAKIRGYFIIKQQVNRLSF